MLKLVTAFQIEYNSIVEYRLSFKQNYDELSFAVYGARIGNKIDYYNFLIRNGIEHSYFLIDDENPNYILGNGTIDIYLDYHIDGLDKGAIGYAIRLNERNKGYGTKILELILERCKELKIEEICVSCYENNIASKKIIEKNGGKLEKVFKDSNLIGLKYWIELEPIKEYIKGL